MSESSAQPLTLKYRPRRFADMVGQKAARVLLLQMILKDKVPPALLLHGAWGSGKTTSARIVASALNCEREVPQERPCGGCVTCQAIVDGKSSDVIEIDAASSGLAEDMRDLRQQVRVQPLARYKVVVLDECHELTAKGQQTLLKVLEEPPPNVVFILATTNVDRVLETIASRCFLVQFQRITLEDISSRLLYIAQQEGFPLSRELALAIADRSHGAMRDAVMLLDQCTLVGVQTPEHLVQLMGDNDVALRLIEALVKGDYAGAYACSREGLQALPSPADLMARVVDALQRQLVLASLKGSGASSPLSPPPTEAELALAGWVEPLRVVTALGAVWDYHRTVLPVNDAFTAMDLLISKLFAALFSGKRATPRPSHTSVTGSNLTDEPNTPAGSSAPAGSVDDFLANGGS